MIPGLSMRIPRPTNFGQPATREGQKHLLDNHHAWTFLKHDWPSDACPTFAQGNAVILSNDLALAVGRLVEEVPWRRLTFVADDILIGQIVDQSVGSNVHHLHFPTSYDHEGSKLTCDSTAEWFVNIKTEVIYELHANVLEGKDKCRGMEERKIINL